MLTGVGLQLGILAAFFAVLEGARRFLIVAWRVAVRVKRLLDMPEVLTSHAADDAAFQEWIISRLDGTGPIRFDSEEPHA